MKRIFFLILLISISISSFSDYTLTRGTSEGEIYFIGPTYTGLGIYHSTDFGSIAICVDSTTNATGIVADLADGILYYRNMGELLYISYNNGQQGSWQLQNGGIYPGFASGRIEGEIYNIFVSHSEDFGQTFLTHTYNGFFGNYLESEIDNQINIGYVFTYKSNVADSVYLLKSIDNYENLYLNNVFSFHWNDAISMTRGTNNGEIYVLNHNMEVLLFSFDYANTWVHLNDFNFGNFYGLEVVGGRTDGELYIKCDYVNMSWQNAHTYILYSNDYGVTFEVFNPFSKGQKPLLANFSAKTIDNDNINLTDDCDSIYYVTGEMPLEVQFYNYSLGEINNFEWDFDNDGTIDSYEENPTFTYIDTGWYSVQLKIYDNYDTNSFLRENYIYVYNTVGIAELKKIVINCFPNPFEDELRVEMYLTEKSDVSFEIYNTGGKKLYRSEKHLYGPGTQMITLSASQTGMEQPGLYFLKVIINGSKSESIKLLKI